MRTESLDAQTPRSREMSGELLRKLAVVLFVGSSNNHIDHNTGHRNGADDLSDTAANCDNNQWDSNIFRTANQSCIH
jgi:hypothetical protein